MPPAAKSHAETRWNVADVVARYEVRAVDVCKCGSAVTLHLATPQGIIVARVDLREFVVKCRGELDHNLNRLPTIADLTDEAALHALDRLPIEGKSYGTAREMTADQLASYQLALAGWRIGRFRTKRAACLHHGIPHLYQGFVSWCKKPAQQEPAAPVLSIEPVAVAAIAGGSA